jgi:hypothetical protein
MVAIRFVDNQGRPAGRNFVQNCFTSITSSLWTDAAAVNGVVFQWGCVMPGRRIQLFSASSGDPRSAGVLQWRMAQASTGKSLETPWKEPGNREWNNPGRKPTNNEFLCSNSRATPDCSAAAWEIRLDRAWERRKALLFSNLVSSTA